ncbi:MAG: PrsW family glutamic-type intramembrane protease [Verrucomicrobiota bacterium]|nr:PrsW family glutamic-type intramembrane protease [Verrucomicrobiota bacterium]
MKIVKPENHEGKIKTFRLFVSVLWPFDALRGLSGTENRNLLVITAIGLVPMVILMLFSELIQVKVAYILTSLYFSVLWAILFYKIFPAPDIRVGTSVFCFIGTALVSVSLLTLLFRLPFVKFYPEPLTSPDVLERFLAFLFYVGFPEETVKVFMLYVLSKRHDIHLPRTFAYYGMICGLGFGIYEGLDYQMGLNRQLATGMDDYLFLNLIRLTTLPVLHAVWTGMAGFFLGFAFLYHRSRIFFYGAALVIPSTLHALFNTFNHSITSLGLAIMSVLLFSLYFTKHDALGAQLKQTTHRVQERDNLP